PVSQPSATEGLTTGSLTVATFTDGNPGDNTIDMTAIIHWGDGNTSTGTVSYSAGTYSVTGGHTYADEHAPYSVTVDVIDIGGSSLTGIGQTQITVADAPLTATCVWTTALKGAHLVNAVLASFTDADPGGTLSDYTATIHWGDGSPDTAGIISQIGS